MILQRSLVLPSPFLVQVLEGLKALFGESRIKDRLAEDNPIHLKQVAVAKGQRGERVENFDEFLVW